MYVFQFIYKCQHSNIRLNYLLYLITLQRLISKKQKVLKWKVEVESRRAISDPSGETSCLYLLIPFANLKETLTKSVKVPMYKPLY